VSSIGLAWHSLFVVYFGYSLLGGIGIGFAYVPPVAGLIRWFPNRKGFASGLAIMGFGGGALLAAPIIRMLMDWNVVPPKSLGQCSTLPIEVVNGQKFLVKDGQMSKVVAAPMDISSLGYSPQVLSSLFGSPDDCFLVDKNASTGAAKTLAILGLVYLIILVVAGIAFQVAPPVVVAPSETSQESSKPSLFHVSSAMNLLLPPNTHVRAQRALRSAQFYRVWLSLFLNATAGIALLGVAKNIVSDVFRKSYPDVVDAAFCAQYVAILSLFNGLGRIFWAFVSDLIGRRATFMIFFAIGFVTYFSLPAICQYPDEPIGLFSFVFMTITAVTVYGGGFAIAPAYLSDLFGTKEVGIIYSKLLTAWSVSGLVGPTLLAVLRRRSEIAAIKNLANEIDPSLFKMRFGLDQSSLPELIQTNVVDIPILMNMIPEGKVKDPTATIYNSTMYVMAFFLICGFAINFTIRPISSDAWVKEGDDDGLAPIHEEGSPLMEEDA